MAQMNADQRENGGINGAIAQEFGALVGGAALDPQSFLGLIKNGCGA